MVNKLIKEDTKMFLTGNEVLAYAANSAEAEFMYGYPITPQNEIMHTWCKLLPKTGAGFLQTEDEISAGFSTIGGIADVINISRYLSFSSRTFCAIDGISDLSLK